MGFCSFDAAEDFDAVHAGQDHVYQRDVGTLLREEFEGALAGFGGEHFVAFLAQSAADGAQRELLIVDDQNRVRHKSPDDFGGRGDGLRLLLRGDG